MSSPPHKTLPIRVQFDVQGSPIYELSTGITLDRYNSEIRIIAPGMTRSLDLMEFLRQGKADDKVLVIDLSMKDEDALED